MAINTKMSIVRTGKPQHPHGMKYIVPESCRNIPAGFRQPACNTISVISAVRPSRMGKPFHKPVPLLT